MSRHRFFRLLVFEVGLVFIVEDESNDCDAPHATNAPEDQRPEIPRMRMRPPIAAGTKATSNKMSSYALTAFTHRDSSRRKKNEIGNKIIADGDASAEFLSTDTEFSLKRHLVLPREFFDDTPRLF